MSTAWLKAHIPGFSDLTRAERGAIANFTLLWTIFEARVLATRGNAGQIADAVETWEQNGTLDAASYDRNLAYFRDRYYGDGQFTHYFEGLHLRNNDRPALVRSVLDGTDNGDRNRLIAVLIIVLRYRNNLFHGVKWQYKLAGQLENFKQANTMLKRVLEQHGNLAGP